MPKEVIHLHTFRGGFHDEVSVLISGINKNILKLASFVLLEKPSSCVLCPLIVSISDTSPSRSCTSCSNSMIHIILRRRSNLKTCILEREKQTHQWMIISLSSTHSVCKFSIKKFPSFFSIDIPSIILISMFSDRKFKIT